MDDGRSMRAVKAGLAAPSWDKREGILDGKSSLDGGSGNPPNRPMPTKRGSPWTRAVKGSLVTLHEERDRNGNSSSATLRQRSHSPL